MQRRPMQLSEEHEELGRYWTDFSFLDQCLRWLCADLIAIDRAMSDRVAIVTEEVDVSRLCQVVIPRLISGSTDPAVRALKWSGKGGIQGPLLKEIDWRNVVAHSAWSPTMVGDGIELWYARRGAPTAVTVALIKQHRRGVERLQNDVFNCLHVVLGETTDMDGAEAQ